ncbi:hypothetical protein Fmac_009820 [Flemingia macrophylla]|uniref:LisH domain-containing protein n=1 Tax=Flemingia macrophylla TaxID=520843 RepID=A0ABD1N1A3_9FABA
MASPPNDDGSADKIFQLYLHDYMIKKGMHSAAEIFKKEAQVPENPIGIKFLDSTDDSPNGLLHEWWSIFYEVFSSRQGKDQETGSGSSSKVPMMMSDNAGNNALLRIPGILMNAQKTPQFQVNPCINDMMTQQIVGIMPSTMYNQENLGYQPKNVEPSFQIQAKNKSKSLSRANSKNLPQGVGKQTKKQVSKGIQIGMGAERDTHSAPLDVMQNTMLPLEGFCETSMS